MKTRIPGALLTSIFCLSAPAGPPVLGKAATGTFWVGSFSSSQPGQPPADWKVWDLRKPRATEYRIARLDGQTVLEAESEGSASALIREVAVDPRDYPYLNWTWKTEGPWREGKWNSREEDDFPARIFVIFEEKRGLFSSLGNAVQRLGGGFSGLALNYVWTEGEFANREGRSPVSDRVEMIAVQSGGRADGAWRSQRRNVLEDFRRAFGEAPGKIVAVAVMTDTDDTGGRATSYYGDIYFSSGLR